MFDWFLGQICCFKHIWLATCCSTRPWEQHCGEGSAVRISEHTHPVHMLRTSSLIRQHCVRLSQRPSTSSFVLSVWTDQSSLLIKPDMKMICSHQCVCEGNSGGDVQAFISSCTAVISVNTHPASANKSTICYCSRSCVPLHTPLSGESKATDTDNLPQKGLDPIIHQLCWL